MDIDKKSSNSIGKEVSKQKRVKKRAEDLDEISNEELAQAYDNNSQSNYPDNVSQYSASKVSIGGGNGNPNKLPGIPTGPAQRPRAVASMLERNHSVGSASVGKVGEVKYDMAGGSNANLAASSSFILDE